MKTTKTNRVCRPAMQMLLFIFLFSLFSFSARSNYSEEELKFKSEYKIKRVPDGTVTIYTLKKDGRKEEYIFKDFNADVVLSIYRRIRVSQITTNLAKKYTISEDESRRGIKRVLNALNQWGMITEY